MLEVSPSVFGGGGRVSSLLGERPPGIIFNVVSCRSPCGESVSASDTASPRSSSTSYARRELVRRISSVSSVRVVERRACWALRVEMWDWVWEARVERVRGGCWGLVEGVVGGGGRWVLR